MRGARCAPAGSLFGQINHHAPGRPLLGNVFRNAVKRGLRGGFTSGDFVTGRMLNSVQLREPEVHENGGSIIVGTDQTDPPYPLYWELGHQNLVTGKYERVEIWGPAFRDNKEAAIAAYRRAFARKLYGTGVRQSLAQSFRLRDLAAATVGAEFEVDEP